MLTTTTDEKRTMTLQGTVFPRRPGDRRFCRLDGRDERGQYGLVEDLSVRRGERAPCFDGEWRVGG